MLLELPCQIYYKYLKYLRLNAINSGVETWECLVQIPLTVLLVVFILTAPCSLLIGPAPVTWLVDSD